MFQLPVCYCSICWLCCVCLLVICFLIGAYCLLCLLAFCCVLLVAFRLRCVRLMWPVAVRWAYVETYSRVCERKTEHRSTASRSGHCTVSV